MGRIPKPVRNPQKMVDPRVLTPLDQIARYYGGRGATLDAMLDARELAGQLDAMGGADAENYRQMFPRVEYSRYTDPMIVNPIPGEMIDPTVPTALGDPDYGVLSLPDEPTTQMGQIQMATGDMIDAPEMASEMPMISFAQERPRKIPFVDADPSEADLPQEHGVGDLLNQFEAQRAKEGLRRGEVGRSVEMPMTEYVTMTPDEMDARVNQGMNPEVSDFIGDPDEELGAQVARDMGREIDPVLAQIRRSAGAAELQPEQASQLIGDAIRRASDPMFGADVVDATTGLTMDKLQMLAELPPSVQAFLPRRIRELLSLGGISTGLLSQGGEPQQQGIDPRSTMGPLGGLMD